MACYSPDCDNCDGSGFVVTSEDEYNCLCHYPHELCDACQELTNRCRARIEERRRPRLEMMRTMKAAIAEIPGRSDMVFEVLVGMDYPGPEGENVRSEAGDIVTYLPPTSTTWLIKEGHVRPLCTTGQSGEDCGCKWCRMAALTEEDREWLSLYGWANPFLKAAE